MDMLKCAIAVNILMPLFYIWHFGLADIDVPDTMQQSNRNINNTKCMWMSAVYLDIEYNKM